MSDTTQETATASSISPSPSLSLEQTLVDYEQAIQAVNAAGPTAGLEIVIDVLCARDRVESFLVEDQTNVTAKTLVKIVDLDDQLKHLSPVIANQKQLESCRESIKLPKKHWWWFLSPPPVSSPKLPGLASQNWFWNGLTVACLVLSTSFVTNTLKAFSKDGFDLFQTFSAISQGAGLVLVSGGALTDKGRKIASDIFSSINVPSDYQAEGMFAISAAILATTYGINQSLPTLGRYYYRWGQEAYEQGRLFTAEENFNQAMNFAPHDHRISTALGNIYESIGNYEKASSLYQGGFITGHPEALNGIGRFWLRTAKSHDDLLQAETSLRLALASPSISPALQAEVHSHLGLTLLKQASMAEESPEKVKTLLNETAQVLKQGNEIDQTITEHRDVGLGMGYCYLAEVLKRQGKQKESTEQWELCTTHAIPTSMSEYQDVLVFGGVAVADRLDTSEILSEDIRRSQGKDHRRTQD